MNRLVSFLPFALPVFVICFFFSSLVIVIACGHGLHSQRLDVIRIVVLYSCIMPRLAYLLIVIRLKLSDFLELIACCKRLFRVSFASTPYSDEAIPR